MAEKLNQRKVVMWCPLRGMPKPGGACGRSGPGWLCDSHCSAHSWPVPLITCVVVARKVATIQNPLVGRWEGMEWPGGMLESVLGLMNSRLWAVSLLSLRFCDTRLSASQANRACLMRWWGRLRKVKCANTPAQCPAPTGAQMPCTAQSPLLQHYSQGHCLSAYVNAGHWIPFCNCQMRFTQHKYSFVTVPGGNF